MPTKLPHERLRDYAISGINMKEDLFKEIDNIDWMDHDAISNYTNALADEIERYYIPRPRFEDGEPVQLSDEVDGNLVRMIEVSDDGSWMLFNASGCQIQKGNIFQQVKRPAHKVLDADGIEIEVGDAVWRVKDGFEMKVIAVGREAFEHGCEVLTLLPDDSPDDYGKLHYNGKELTHQEPDR